MIPKIGFFGIDYQNDFMDQPNAALPVTGAVADAKRIAAWFTKFAKQIEQPYFSLDSHRRFSIERPGWFFHADGSLVGPNTPISLQDVESGKFYAGHRPGYTLNYLKALEATGQYSHFIWNPHCEIGTPGHAFQSDISAAITHYELTRQRYVGLVTKGTNPNTEHFSPFQAAVPVAGDPDTQLNQDLLRELTVCDLVYFSGEARSHCVANALRDLCNEAPTLLPKLVILSDGMSDVVGVGLPQSFYDGVDAIYARAKSMGARFMKTTDFSNTLYI